MSTVIRERDQPEEDADRYAKRAKTDDNDVELPVLQEFQAEEPMITSGPVWDHVLPPSHSLLGLALPETKPDEAMNFLETDVGISEYIGRGDAKIEGIIKQRCACCLLILDHTINCILQVYRLLGV